jgi:hypothetical protein
VAQAFEQTEKIELPALAETDIGSYQHFVLKLVRWAGRAAQQNLISLCFDSVIGFLKNRYS